MSTFSPDSGGQTLVTDLVHELSSGLEIPFLLSGSPASDYERKEIYNELLFDSEKCDVKYNDVFCGKEENDLWMDQDVLSSANPGSFKCEEKIVSEYDELEAYLSKNEIYTTFSKTDSSGHGSGSDTSSTELWTTKSERNVSPVMTSPEERISPVIFFSSNELHFIPVSREGSGNNLAHNSNNGRMMKIQPKPNISTFNVTGNKELNKMNTFKTFKDIKTSLLSNGNDTNGIVQDLKNTILCRKHLEILQAKRKQERMMRNRESAYLSRKKKKEYVTNLEKQVQDLVNENNRLRQENHDLKERLMNYEDATSFNKDKKFKKVFMNSPKRTTTIFALMLTICFNVGSFSNFLNPRTGGPVTNGSPPIDGVPFHVQNAKHSTRSLLWTDPELDDLKSLANISKTSCPINQTESIRLESELRRWIRGDDDFSRPTKRNVNNKEQNLFTLDRPFTSQNKLKKKHRVRKMNSPSDVEVDVFRMKRHFFNFDTFFEAINRRDDTFYLVSFSADHLLLPALAHNKTSRPKMSLMLPAFLSNGTLDVSSEQVEMMQIDCEVTNTQLFSVNENDIPSHMRPYSNTTSKHQRSPTGETAAGFSEFLYESMHENKSAGESRNRLLRREIRNYSLSRINSSFDSGSIQLMHKDQREKGVTPILDRLHRNYNGENENFQSSDEYLFNQKSTGRSKKVDGSNMQFLDANSKGFLKTLIVPSPLSDTRNFGFNKKQYVKDYKRAMKILFP